MFSVGSLLYICMSIAIGYYSLGLQYIDSDDDSVAYYQAISKRNSAVLYSRNYKHKLHLHTLRRKPRRWWWHHPRYHPRRTRRNPRHTLRSKTRWRRRYIPRRSTKHLRTRNRRWRRRHTHRHTPRRHNTHLHRYLLRYNRLLRREPRRRRRLCECTCKLTLVWALIPWHGWTGSECDWGGGWTGGDGEGVVFAGLGGEETFGGCAVAFAFAVFFEGVLDGYGFVH